jgi:nuclear GTP-binding protein
VENIEDPVAAVAHLLTRVTDREMMRLYAVPHFGSPHEFLVLLAQQRGKLKKVGLPHTSWPRSLRAPC